MVYLVNCQKRQELNSRLRTVFSKFQWIVNVKDLKIGEGIICCMRQF